jgi:hypothetical protein
MCLMSKEVRINVRTTEQIKIDLEITARLRGLTVSALVNSLVVKAIREEKEREPRAFEHEKPEGKGNAEYVGRHQPDKSIVVETHRKLTDEEADKILDALEDDEPSLEFSEEQIIALLSAHQRRTAQKK